MILLPTKSKATPASAQRSRHMDPESMVDSKLPEYMLQDLEVALSSHRWKTASGYAAIMLVVPSKLLGVSLSYFVVGLGIYIGKMYTANLIPEYGPGSLGILIIFIFTMFSALVAFYIPSAMKSEEASVYERIEDLMRVNQSNTRGTEGEDEAAGSIYKFAPGSVIPLKILRSQTGPHPTPSVHIDQGIDEPAPDEAPDIETDIYDATPPSSRPIGFSYFEPQTPGSADSKVSKAKKLDFIALKDLLKAQEESVNASRRLLESYQSEDPSDE